MECVWDEDIVEELFPFFVARIDTTGHFIAHMTQFLHQSPRSLKQIYEEISRVYMDVGKREVDDDLIK